MEFIKKLFKNEERAIGLCSFKKRNKNICYYTRQTTVPNFGYSTNVKNNFFLL